MLHSAAMTEVDMADEEKKEVVEEAGEKAAEEKEVKKEEAPKEPAQDTMGMIKGKLSSWFGKAKETITEGAKEISDVVQEKGGEVIQQGKTLVDEKKRDYEMEKHFVKLGRAVYELVLRSELTLPESCEKYIEALKDLDYRKDSDKAEEGSEEEKKEEEKKED